MAVVDDLDDAPFSDQRRECVVVGEKKETGGLGENKEIVCRVFSYPAECHHHVVMRTMNPARVNDTVTYLDLLNTSEPCHALLQVCFA